MEVEARLVGATLDEGWPAMATLLADVRPGLVIVDGEEELYALAASTFPDVPVQRCLFHLAKGGAKTARYGERASATLTADFAGQLRRLLSDAYRDGDEAKARTAYDDRIDDMFRCGALAAAAHLRGARDEALTFLTNPDVGRLVFGDKGYPELGTGVLERVMREMNRRTDVGVRWSVEGVRGILMVKLGIKYRHGRWAPNPAPNPPTRCEVRPRGLRPVSGNRLATEPPLHAGEWPPATPGRSSGHLQRRFNRARPRAS
ncbi:MAG: transposase [Actinobacteria bacterium]|nr:transposase [Actinomycetota bacterium]